MRRRITLGAILLACSAVFAAGAAAEPVSRLALVGGMLLDGSGGAPIHHAAILIEHGRIFARGPASEVIIPAGTPVIDTSGETMMPGMIDVHAHLALVGHGDIERWFSWLEAHPSEYPIQRVMELSARQLLAAGITSAADLGAPLQESIAVRDRINRGIIPGPRLSISGPWLIPAPAIFPTKYQVIVHTALEAARATEDAIRGGADVIKLHGGLTPDQYAAIIEVAHKHHIKVHAHLYDEEDVRNAFAAGVDVLQHVGSAGTPPYSAALVKEIAESGRPVVPTAAHRVWVFPATREFPERLDEPSLRQQFPLAMWTELSESFRDISKLGYFNKHEQEEANGDASINQWVKSGAVIGMGSDSGSPLNFHADALWREAKVFVDHGMPATKVIAALTSVNARIPTTPESKPSWSMWQTALRSSALAKRSPPASRN
jgi:imidazolonepropionase-like amidohydrolase